MKAPSPAFSFYPKDILSDEHCAAMTNEEFGCYVRLLCHAWLEGSAPSDPIKIARILKLHQRTFSKVWPAIAPCWEERDGRLYQLRMERDRVLQVARSESASRAGIESGKVRAFNKSTQRPFNGSTNEAPTDDEPSVSVSVSVPSSVVVPSPSLEQLESRRGFSAANASALVAVPAGLRKVPDSWSGRFCSDWKDLVAGDGGRVPGGKIGQYLLPLVSSRGEDAVRPVWQHYLKHEQRPAPAFFAENFGKWEAAFKSGRGLFDRPSLEERNRAVSDEWARGRTEDES